MEESKAAKSDLDATRMQNIAQLDKLAEHLPIESLRSFNEQLKATTEIKIAHQIFSVFVCPQNNYFRMFT